MNASHLSAPACRNHPRREAAAKCKGCAQSFCKECVTLLEHRMFCASCYAMRTAPEKRRSRDWFVCTVAVQTCAGLAGLWLCAYLAGTLLLKLPTSFHEGTFWKSLVSHQSEP